MAISFIVDGFYNSLSSLLEFLCTLYTLHAVLCCVSFLLMSLFALYNENNKKALGKGVKNDYPKGQYV